MSEFLRAQGLMKEYRQGETALQVLRGVSLEIEPGAFVVIVGPSGAGKSTLLHLLGLLDTPTNGTISFEGQNLSKLSGPRQAKLRNQLFGFVFQFYFLLPDFNALENVMMPALVRHGGAEWFLRRGPVRERARQLLVSVGLEERLRHRPSQLSGGERQRVALCRALINEPRVLLLDEPTGNLDRKTGEQIQDLIEGLHAREKQTIVLVTHDESFARRAQRVVRLRDGQIA